MKVKMKLDVASIKNWMLEHGEKLALGIVGIVVLLLTYSAIQREVLDAEKQPDKLQELARSVDDHVRNSLWDAKREDLQVVNYAERAKSRPVGLSDYPLVKPFNRPEFDPKAKRGVPEVLGVEELRVAAGYDLFSVKVEKAAGATGGQRDQRQAQPWAVVTGLVPVARQQQEYEQAFSQAVGGDSGRDVPQYYAPVLQRTSQVDEADPEKVKWTRVPSVKRYEDRWVKSATEIVSLRYVNGELTGRLGSLANQKQQWGESVGHPKIPLESEEDEPANQSVEPQQAAQRNEAAQDNEQGFFGPKQEANRPQATNTDKSGQPEVIEYRLLRAFDYSVEPGKRYRYRVILGLTNPNHGLPPQQLKDPESARAEYLASQPSESTAVVTIPDGHRVLAGPVNAGTRYSEPSATLLVTAIDKQEGLEAATELTRVRRGTLANAEQETVRVRRPGFNDPAELTLDFRSNTLVLDIYGGRNLSNRRRADPITSPGEILLLDAEGNMIVRNEMDDWAQYESTIVRDPAVEAPKKKPLLNPDKRKPRIRRPR